MKLDYEVSEISLEDARPVIQNNNDKEDIFGIKYPDEMSHHCYGLFNKNKLVGAVQFVHHQKHRHQRIFHKEHYGCYTDTCEGFYELARLAVEPQDEHNLSLIHI